MERLRFMLGGADDPDEVLLDESDGLCSLSPMQRVYAFAACLGAGLLFMILSLIVFYKPIKFAVLFIFGNILAIGSTAFLIGPVQQARMMFDPVRMYATVIYVVCVILALVFALSIHNRILTLLAIILEICSFIWYSLSYIPFARRIVSELFISCCDTEI
ncbi:hypothetical protein QJS10_CPA03g00165 [Acorus calamus]|uniref:Vesicle transport protein n=1 Tax=Acorus calamus TaxID=4465 RepID=A0AAV9F8G2_ACOCL|nr:hypothetical protein QJS10_CPA03g00165 [Acorus calamus]